MATLFQNLGYNYSDPHGDVVEFSADTKDHMNTVPSLIETWQTEDISSSNVGSYLQNPVSTVSNTISIAANAIINVVSTIGTYTNSGVANVMVYVSNSSNNLITTASNFKDHTDRVSGVVNFGDAVVANSSAIMTKPFREPAKGLARSLMYIIYQTDGVSNTSVMSGYLTSLFTGPEMNVYATSLQTYSNTINSSISLGTSNLTLTQANTINTSINEAITFMDTRRTHDETFYTNMKTMLADYNTVRQFSNLGESETTILNDYTGTSKLLTRIN